MDRIVDLEHRINEAEVWFQGINYGTQMFETYFEKFRELVNEHARLSYEIWREENKPKVLKLWQE